MLLEQFTIAKVVHRGGEADRCGASGNLPEGVLKPLTEALEALGKADCAGLPIGVG